MHSLPRRTIQLAVLFSALAGYVDAIGFMNLSGYFVSFMSGNSTRLGIAFGQHAWVQIIQAIGLIFMFLVGVVCSPLIAHAAKQSRTTAVLSFVAVLLVLAALSFQLGHQYLAGTCQVMAMGAINLVFARNGNVSVGLTYMTGSLVKAGKQIARAILGESRWEFAPYLWLWAGLVGGAALGASLSAVGAPVLLTAGAIYTALLIPLANRHVNVPDSED